MKCISCFRLYPSILDAYVVQGLMKEIFPAMKTDVVENELEMYITKEEYVFVLNELFKLHNYSKSMPDSYEDINRPVLTGSPIEANIVERYSVLFDLMFEAKSGVKHVQDDFKGSDYEGSEFIIGKKFSKYFDIDQEYQEFLKRKAGFI